MRVPKKIRRKLNRKYVAARGVSDWWNDPLRDAACVFQKRLWSQPAEHRCWKDAVKSARKFRRYSRNTTKVALGCGGKAVFAYYVYKVWKKPDDSEPGYWRLRSKGWLGIGAAATACTFDEMFDRWW